MAPLEHTLPTASLDSSLYIELTFCALIKNENKQKTFETDEYVLIYMRSGSGDFSVGSRTMQLFSGDFLIGRTGDPKTFIPSQNEPCEYYLFSFGGRHSTDLLTAFKLTGRESYFVGHDNALVAHLDRTIDEFNKKDSISNLVASALFVAALGDMTRLAIHIFSQDLSKGYDKIAPALSSINSDCTSKLGVDEYAKLCNLSTSYFTHLFTKITGFSPMEYKQLQRINIAKNLLSTTNLSIKEISTVIGFKDPLYFGRCFKQATGQTPSGYRTKKI